MGQVDASLYPNQEVYSWQEKWSFVLQSEKRLLLFLVLLSYLMLGLWYFLSGLYEESVVFSMQQ